MSLLFRHNNGWHGDKRHGVRFRLFPQSPHLAAFQRPITVWLDKRAGRIWPGPSDDRFYVIDPAASKLPYDDIYQPPYEGPAFPPIAPDSQGNFDYINVGTREFNAAHLFAAVRCTMDIWEAYFGRRIAWHFRHRYKRMELIPFVDWENAQSGFGFIETGYDIDAAGQRSLLCLNFDVIAHELGHSIIYAEVGIPTPLAQTDEYFAFQESAADLCALIASLHFENVVDHVLDACRGNLYASNEMNRIGELTEIEQIRLASNIFKMSHFQNGFKTPHFLGLPLSGAIFDLFVDVFQSLLWQRGFINKRLAWWTSQVPDPSIDDERLQDAYDTAYAQHASGFKEALLDARDYLGQNLAMSWQQLNPNHLHFTDVELAMLSADQVLTGGEYQQRLRANFNWREIGQVSPGPNLSSNHEATHASAVGCR